MRRRPLATALLCVACILPGARPAAGGPPFVTDDPEPVEHRHWELYVASQHAETAEGWSGTAPHIEVNYGAAPELQLHLIAPLAYDAPALGSRHCGYGDTELGAKYRFIRETPGFPQVGIFPLLEIPSGDARRGLGSGHGQAFLPVWLQKSWGETGRPWTIYGGGGYLVDLGAAHHGRGLMGIVVQRQVRASVLVGGEVYHQTAPAPGGRADTVFDLGTVVDLSDRHHLLLSAGGSIDGPTRLQIYAAYQLTVGPGR